MSLLTAIIAIGLILWIGAVGPGRIAGVADVGGLIHLLLVIVVIVLVFKYVLHIGV